MKTNLNNHGSIINPLIFFNSSTISNFGINNHFQSNILSHNPVFSFQSLINNINRDHSSNDFLNKVFLEPKVDFQHNIDNGFKLFNFQSNANYIPEQSIKQLSKSNDTLKFSKNLNRISKNIKKWNKPEEVISLIKTRQKSKLTKLAK